MNRRRYWIGVSLLLAACSSGGGGTGTGTGGASGNGSGGSSPTGSGGSSPTGSGGATTGSGGSGSGGSSGSGGADAGTTGTGGKGTGGTDGGTDGGADTGTDGMTGTGGAAMAGSQSVTQRGGDPARTGHFVRPAMTKAKAAMLTTDAGFNATYSGTVTGTPLYFENGPGGKGAFFVATQSNNVYAFDETTGAQLWMKNAGTTANGGCDGQGKGIMSAPALDPASRTLFVAAANGPGNIQSFKVHAYNIDDGMERTGWPVDIGQALGSPNMGNQNQRGALLLVNGILYVPLGGQVGDCSGARGRVAAINITDPTKTGGWSTTDDGSAIWAPGGLASDGTGVFGLTGNHFPNFSAPGTHADSEELFRLTGLAQLTRNNANIFYPSRWQAMDSGDLDFGANSPLVMDIPGATPARMVAAPSKDGHIYFVDPSNLGGMGGQKFDLLMANEGMSLLKTTPASYVTNTGAYVVLSTQGARGCPAGGANGTVVMGVSVPVTAGAIKPAVKWCAAVGGDTSPIVTTTDGKTDAVVWYVSGGVLKGVDGDTGASVFSGGACQVQRWTSAIAAKGARIVAAGNGKLCSFSAM